MDARLAAKIAVRVLALWIAAHGILPLPQVADAVIQHGDAVSALVIPLLLLELGPLIVAVTLWIFSPKIAIWMVGKADGTSSSESPSADNLQTAAFATVGLVLAILAASYIVGILAMSVTSPTDFYSLMHTYVFYEQFTKLVLGLAFMLGAGFFTRLFRRLREFGAKADS